MANHIDIEHTLLAEALSQETPALDWRQINQTMTPIAVVDLQKFNAGMLVCSPVDSDHTEQFIEPFKATWDSQFDQQTSLADKWIDGYALAQFYKHNPSIENGLPCSGGKTFPYAEFFFAIHSELGIQQNSLGGVLVGWDKSVPEALNIKAMAISPELRKLGLGGRLIEYAILMLDQHKIGKHIIAFTNERGDQVSGGWSPVHAWERWGFKQFGRLPNQGLNDSAIGDGIYLDANLSELAKKYQDGRWKNWCNQLQSSF